MMATTAITIFSLLLMLIQLAIIIYFVLLAGRLVRAVERIADKIGTYRPSTESENL